MQSTCCRWSTNSQVLCILLHIVFFLICVQVSIRCHLIIRWCLFSGMYCVVVVLGVAMHMKVMTSGRWVGWRRGIGEVTGEKLGTVVTVMCTVWLTALNKLHSWSKHANNLVSLVYVIWHYKIWKSNNMSCAAQRSEGHVCGNVWRAMFHNVEHTGNICFLARYSEGWCSSAQDFCWLG